MMSKSAGRMANSVPDGDFRNLFGFICGLLFQTAFCLPEAV